VPRAHFREPLLPHLKARQIALAAMVARAQPGQNCSKVYGNFVSEDFTYTVTVS